MIAAKLSTETAVIQTCHSFLTFYIMGSWGELHSLPNPVLTTFYRGTIELSDEEGALLSPPSEALVSDTESTSPKKTTHIPID